MRLAPDPKRCQIRHDKFSHWARTKAAGPTSYISAESTGFRLGLNYHEAGLVCGPVERPSALKTDAVLEAFPPLRTDCERARASVSSSG